jgi:hypothetical protein
MKTARIVVVGFVSLMAGFPCAAAVFAEPDDEEKGKGPLRLI